MWGTERALFLAWGIGPERLLGSQEGWRGSGWVISTSGLVAFEPQWDLQGMVGPAHLDHGVRQGWVGVFCRQQAELWRGGSCSAGMCEG